MQERMEQVREIDGEQAYEKMRLAVVRDWEGGGIEKSSYEKEEIDMLTKPEMTEHIRSRFRNAKERAGVLVRAFRGAD